MGDDLEVTYKIGALTDELRRDIREKDRELKGFDHGIREVVTEWTWNDDNDDPLPIVDEIIADMPYPLKVLIWEKISEDSSPKELQKTLRTGSVQKAR